jgi:RecA-family ATPase
MIRIVDPYEFARTPALDELEAEQLAISWDQLSTRLFAEEEKILFELERGEVGMLVAATNVGKTTFAINLALSLCVGRAFAPVITESGASRRVLVIDGETRLARFKRDVAHMMDSFTDDERITVGRNLHVSCERVIGDQPLTLSNEVHMAALVNYVKSFSSPLDLIIVDTQSALFHLASENDNAEVSRKVMLPLASLASVSGAGVLLLHHIGKYNEDSQSGIRAYRGRGASAGGASARLVLLMTPEPGASDCVVLSCAKSKGARFDDTVLELDREARWFRAVREAPSAKPDHYETVIGIVRAESKPMRRTALVEKLKGKLTSRSVERILADAIAAGDLYRPSRGTYAIPILPT